MRRKISALLMGLAILALSINFDFALAEEGSGRNLAIDLGWVAIGSGLLGNIPFMLHKRVKKYAFAKLGGANEISREMSQEHSPILTLHLALNTIGFVAGMAHGLIFVSRINAISLSLAMMMTALMVSGFVLRFSKRLSLNLSSRLIHGQTVLTGILVLLVVLHVMLPFGDD